MSAVDDESRFVAGSVTRSSGVGGEVKVDVVVDQSWGVAAVLSSNLAPGQSCQGGACPVGGPNGLTDTAVKGQVHSTC